MREPRRSYPSDLSDDGTLRRAPEVQRALGRLRAGRPPEPRAAVIDSQSAKTTTVGGPSRGHDGGKRVKRPKRHVLVDVMGLVLALCVHASDEQDREGARVVVERVVPSMTPSLQLAWADQGYTGAFAEWLREARGWRLEAVRHADRRSCGTASLSVPSTRFVCCRVGGSSS